MKLHAIIIKSLTIKMLQFHVMFIVVEENVVEKTGIICGESQGYHCNYLRHSLLVIPLPHANSQLVSSV